MSSNAFINDTGICSSPVCVLIIGSHHLHQFIVRVYIVNFIIDCFSGDVKDFFFFLRMDSCDSPHSFYKDIISCTPEACHSLLGLRFVV